MREMPDEMIFQLVLMLHRHMFFRKTENGFLVYQVFLFIKFYIFDVSIEFPVSSLVSPHHTTLTLMGMR